MSKVINQIGKVNSEKELQKMAMELKQIAKYLFEPGEAIENYEALKEMQLNFNYNQNYSDDSRLNNLVLKMETMREFFLGLYKYHQAFHKHTDELADVTINFKHTKIV